MSVLEKLFWHDYHFNLTCYTKISFVFSFRYSLEDLNGERMFLLNMDLSVCFEAEGSCSLKLPLLRDVFIPKPVCNLDQGFPKFGNTKKLHAHVVAINELVENVHA